MKKLLLSTALLAATTGLAAAQDCDVTIGLVLELTGPAGAYGQAGAKAIEMAFNDINTAGGIDGCDIKADIRDSQSQGTVAVDQATQLVNIAKVPVVIGGIISSVSIPMLTSVTAPAKVVQVSPASSSPTLTALGEDGKTGGYFFRTITSDALQGTAAAKYAMDQGLTKLAIINVNNDFGLNMMREFTKSYEALGGEITSTTPYNEKQSSYASEATVALKGDPDALYLISYPVDGATIARAWISSGGPQKFLLNDGMNAQEFIQAVGPQYLEDAYGTSSGTTETASTEYFYSGFKEFSGGIAPDAPAADRSYDAGAIVALAAAEAGSQEPEAIRDAIHAVVAEGGEPIYAGPDEFKKALDLIKAGKPIKYEGVIGPVTFDQYGDITGPFRLWEINDGEVETVGQMSAAEVSAIKAEVE
ncbi:amino acid ABC transporter substrate-binding protein [Pseudooceanicola sediminis]|uniref:Amino acid ABC transporter substrate-binding protein n=1 Tax=Pseudooceanicola sediminis TaxID=2211117 RepID=A0A399IZA3_9RHOB|nr:ABC transporter substrate-binding protein [Pseudooceanicola sediminis]KAA2313680.1 ABC transporter substrate-binding protein [Puniceibacterium sp. HSS470]RII38483.1 amino acid ABC transporter substrate-binding protein [Pseudooceanicola sediminis]|tara:strand:- start:87331 stop:88584 length:1254 start_codon:yes stop_codon:yes gene_type:complete